VRPKVFARDTPIRCPLNRAWSALDVPHTIKPGFQREQGSQMEIKRTISQEVAAYELRYQSLLEAGHTYVFPCDADGHVNMDALSDAVREMYLYVRAVVGREVSAPAVIGASVQG
jgi:hypothetical protein